MSERVKQHHEFRAERHLLVLELEEAKQCADAAITDKFKEIAKVERLRAESEALARSHKDLAHKLADAGREIDRLRAELDRLKKSDREWREMFGARDLNLDDELQEEIDRLRARNAELREMAKVVIHISDDFKAGMGPQWGGDPLTDAIDELRAILDKTAKEGKNE